MFISMTLILSSTLNVCKAQPSCFKIWCQCSAIDHSQARNGRLCRFAVTDLGEFDFALAITIRGRGLGCEVALRIYICGALRQTSDSNKKLCSEKLVTTHNVSLRILEDFGPSLLHTSPAELPTHNSRAKGDYSCKNLEMGTGLTFRLCLFVLRLCTVHVLYCVQLVRDLNL